MSVRPREAFEAAQQFSLRDALGADPSAPQLPATAGGNLKFNLSGISSKPSAPSPTAAEATTVRPVTAPSGLSLRFAQAPVAEPKKPILIPAAGPMLPNLSFASVAQSTGKHSILGSQYNAIQAKEQANHKADVMRLTAYVDELTARIKKTQHRLEQTEQQLTRTSQVLCHERQASDQMLSGYKKDLAQAHDTETKLRAEIAANKKKSALTDSTFMSSVGSALASDEQIRLQQRNLSELETKVGAMGDFKVKLESEIAKLEGLRKAAIKDLEEQRVANEEQVRIAAVAKEELSSAQKQLAEIKADHGTITERLATAKVEEATLSEALSAMRVEKAKAEAETASARSATQAMLLEHGDAARKLCELQTQIKGLQAKEEEAAKTLQATEARALAAATAVAELPTDAVLAQPASVLEPSLNSCSNSCLEGDKDASCEPAAFQPPAPNKPAKRRAMVSGALAPDHQLCTGMDMANMPGGSGAGHASNSVVSMLATDAPIELTMQRVAFVGSTHAIFIDAPTGATGTTSASTGKAASEMIKAVVGDLKNRWMELSQQHPPWRPVAPLA